MASSSSQPLAPVTPAQAQIVAGAVGESGVGVVIGGQAITFWATYLKAVEDQTSIASKDVDILGTVADARSIAALIDGEVFLPKIDDATPNAALIAAEIDGSMVEVDVLKNVLGARDQDVVRNAVPVVLRPDPGKPPFKTRLMHPLDCVKSRYANLNTLRRETPLAIKQAVAALVVLDRFVEMMLAAGQAQSDPKKSIQSAQRILRNFYYVARDGYLRGPIARKYPDLCAEFVLRKRLDDERFSEKWRRRSLKSFVDRYGRDAAKLGLRA